MAKDRIQVALDYTGFERLKTEFNIKGFNHESEMLETGNTVHFFTKGEHAEPSEVYVLESNDKYFMFVYV